MQPTDPTSPPPPAVPPPPVWVSPAGPLPAGPGRSRANRRAWIFIIAGGLVLLCVGCAFLGIGGLQAVRILQQGNDATTAVLDQFMQAGLRDDPQAGYALFSTTSANTTLADVTSLFQTDRTFFDGYQAVHEGNYRINSGTSGTTATISGTVSYSTHADVPFTANLIKENSQWKLISFQFLQGISP